MVTVPFVQFKTAISLLRKTAPKGDLYAGGTDHIRMSIEKNELILETDDGECHGIVRFPVEGELERLTVPLRHVIAAIKQVATKKGDLTLEEVLTEKKGHPCLRLTSPEGTTDIEIEDTSYGTRQEFPNKPRVYGDFTSVAYEPDSTFVEALEFLLSAEGDGMQRRGFLRGIIFDRDLMAVTDGQRAHLELNTPHLTTKKTLCPLSAFVALAELLRQGAGQVCNIKYYPFIKNAAVFLIESTVVTTFGSISLAVYAEEGKEAPPHLDDYRAKWPVTDATATGITVSTADLEAAVNEICHTYKKAGEDGSYPVDMMLEVGHLRYSVTEDYNHETHLADGEVYTPDPDKLIQIGGFIPCNSFYAPYPVQFTVNAKFLRQAMKHIGDRTHFVFWHPVKAANKAFFVYGDLPGRLAILMPMNGQFFDEEDNEPPPEELPAAALPAIQE